MPVALNVSKANAQIAQLKQQSAAASHTARLLSLYKTELMRSWSGIEADYLIKAINTQIRACQKLSNESNALCRDIAQAIEDILSEEGAGDPGTISG